MSKIKDQILRDQDLQMEYYFKFMDKMYDALKPELNESDIEKMESSYCNSSNSFDIKSSEIIPLNSSSTAKANELKDVA